MEEGDMLEDPVERLFRRFDLEQTGDDHFVGQPGPGRTRVFGGLVAGMALVAAGRTAGGRPCDGIHASFLRGGTYDVPIHFAVERTLEGRTFQRRRVTARQDDAIILDADVSFAWPEEGLAHSDPMPIVPMTPEIFPEWELAAIDRDAEPGLTAGSPLDTRVIDTEPFSRRGDEGRYVTWTRMRGPIPEDPLLHAAALVYLSDRGMMMCATRRYDMARGSILASTLDHAVWFLGTPRMDGWILYDTRSPAGRQGRTVSHGALWSFDGTCLASTAQHGILRAPRP
jgi:acyl-CoA thioesterase-2